MLRFYWLSKLILKIRDEKWKWKNQPLKIYIHGINIDLFKIIGIFSNFVRPKKDIIRYFYRLTRYCVRCHMSRNWCTRIWVLTYGILRVLKHFVAKFHSQTQNPYSNRSFFNASIAFANRSLKLFYAPLCLEYEEFFLLTMPPARFSILC